MTDQVASMAMIASDANVFSIGCVRPHDSMVLAFRSEQFLASTTILTASRPFSFRFDDDQAETSEWYYDGNIAREYSGPSLRRFLRRMVSASRLRIRAITYEGRPVDVEFDVRGAGPIVRQAIEACGDRRARDEILPLLR